MCDVAGWQRRGVTCSAGARACLPEWLQLRLRWQSSFPPDPSTTPPPRFWPTPSNVMPVCRVLVGLRPAANHSTRMSSRLVSSRLAACPRSCAVSLPLPFCLGHPLTPLSACCQSSNNLPTYPLLHTLPTRPSKHSQRHRVSLSTVHAPRQTLTIPRPSYPCSPRAPTSLVRLHPLVHHTHSCPPPI